MTYRIPLSYNPINVEAYAKVLTSYEGIHHNQIVTDFENALVKLTGMPHAVAVNSGTAAIHLALLSLGIGAGDVVIAPTFTYVATVNPILYVGARPVLIDSERETWNMDPILLEEALDSLKKKGISPKAIVIVHTYGMPAKINEIITIAERENIPIIEDAAESLGSIYEGRMTGTFGRIGIFSFNNNKSITTYGGGVLITKDPHIAEQARFYASQARENQPFYEHQKAGFNYLMSPLNAAMGLSQLPMLEAKSKSRKEVFMRYVDSIGASAVFQHDTDFRISNRWLSTILIGSSLHKELIARAFNGNGIESRPLWKPMHRQPLYRNEASFLNGNSDDFFDLGLALPSAFSTSKHQLEVMHALTG